MGRFEDVLAGRRVPEPSPHLEMRIIAAAGKISPAAWGLAAAWDFFREAFALPRPAFVMVLIVLGGSLLGFYAVPVGQGEDMFSEFSYDISLTEDFL